MALAYFKSVGNAGRSRATCPIKSFLLRDSPKSKKRIINKLGKLKNVRQVNKLAYYEQPNLFNLFN